MPRPIINRKTVTMDATGVSMGRLATQIARILIGKHKATYVPNADVGDAVVVKNPGAMKLTGTKATTKEYFHYSGYPGGMRTRTSKEKMATNPGWMIKMAVDRMLPKNTFRARRIKRLTFAK